MTLNNTFKYILCLFSFLIPNAQKNMPCVFFEYIVMRRYLMIYSVSRTYQFCTTAKIQAIRKSINSFLERTMSDAHASQKRIKYQHQSFIVSPGNCITSYLANYIIELSIIIVYVSMITGLHKKINVYLAKHINIVRPNEI